MPGDPGPGSKAGAPPPTREREPRRARSLPLAVRSLPLDRGGGLARDVVDDAVDAADLVDDAAADAPEEIGREDGPVGGHAVAALDGADGDHVVVGALVPHDADGVDRHEDGEGLPEAV